MAKTGTIRGALVAVIRGAILPYFGKQGNYLAYSLLELKKGIIWGFPVLTGISGRETEPE